MKFRVIGGNHVEGKSADGSRRIYRKNDIIDTQVDLISKFGPKFELLDDAVQATKVQPTGFSQTPKIAVPKVDTKVVQEAAVKGFYDKDTDEDFNKMSIAELRSFAQTESIELGMATKKDDIIKIIRDSLATEKV